MHLAVLFSTILISACGGEGSSNSTNNTDGGTRQHKKETQKTAETFLQENEALLGQDAGASDPASNVKTRLRLATIVLEMIKEFGYTQPKGPAQDVNLRNLKSTKALISGAKMFLDRIGSEKSKEASEILRNGLQESEGKELPDACAALQAAITEVMDALKNL